MLKTGKRMYIVSETIVKIIWILDDERLTQCH